MAAGPDPSEIIANGVRFVPEDGRPDPATNARVTREAIRSLSHEPGCGELFGALAAGASNEALNKLRRLIR